jgi:hypothetical protein
MKILTKRNAMLGWATWRAAKGIAKYHKAKKAIPTTPVTAKKKKSKKRKKVGMLAGTAAAVGGVALLKRKRKGKGANGMNVGGGVSTGE